MHRSWVWIGLLPLLGGCAGNAVRVESANVVAGAGHAATDQTSAFIGRVANARMEANLTLVASDPSCRWPLDGKIIIRGTGATLAEPLVQPSPAGERRPLCAATLDPARGDFAVSVAPIPLGALRPTLDLVDALAGYSDALAAIVADDPNAADDGIAAAFDAAASASADIARLANGPAPLKDSQTKAVHDVLTLIDELNRERRQVRDLRKIAASQGGQVKALIGQLKAQITLWTTNSLKGSLEKSILAHAQVLDRWMDTAPTNFEERRQRFAQLAEMQADLAQADAVGGAASDALDTMASANQQFLDALDGRFTPRMRREMGRIARARVLRALHALADVAQSFRPGAA